MKIYSKLNVIGTALLAVGFVLAILAAKSFSEGVAGDADIGTPALLLASEVIGIAGLVLIVLGFIKPPSQSNRR